MLQQVIPHQDEVCKQCEGKGIIPLPERPKSAGAYEMCPKCFGQGKVDWITNSLSNQPSMFYNEITEEAKESYRQLRELSEKYTVSILTATQLKIGEYK